MERNRQVTKKNMGSVIGMVDIDATKQRLPFLMVFYVIVPNSIDIIAPCLKLTIRMRTRNVNKLRCSIFLVLQNFELCYSFTLFHHSIGKKFLCTCFLTILFYHTHTSNAVQALGWIHSNFSMCSLFWVTIER